MTKYYHVDVFSKEIMNGNGLTVVFLDRILSSNSMLKISQEFRQFETIFIQKQGEKIFKANIFTMEEELPFAGHPILGAGACIHKEFFNEEKNIEINLELENKTVTVNSMNQKTHYLTTTNQGPPKFLGEIPVKSYSQISDYLNLQISDLHDKFPLEIVSTGLPYLLVPTRSGLNKCKIIKSGFEEFLSKFGAKFVYVFDINTLEARTWDNEGIVEDVATGSAAGPLCAYLVKHGLQSPNSEIKISQGKFVNRPSIITTRYLIENNNNDVNIQIEGHVSIFAIGTLSLSE